MRSGEVAQLRVADVTVVFGIPVLCIHDRFGSIKNQISLREIPLHPQCIDLLDYVRTLKRPWLFEPAKWRSDRFQRYAGKFLREKAEITDPALTMHSLRHTWRTLARECDMPEAISRAIMGHTLGAGEHGFYGSAPSLTKRAEWIAKIEPLSG